MPARWPRDVARAHRRPAPVPAAALAGLRSGIERITVTVGRGTGRRRRRPDRHRAGGRDRARPRGPSRRAIDHPVRAERRRSTPASSRGRGIGVVVRQGGRTLASDAARGARAAACLARAESRSAGRTLPGRRRSTSAASGQSRSRSPSCPTCSAPAARWRPTGSWPRSSSPPSWLWRCASRSWPPERSAGQLAASWTLPAGSARGDFSSPIPTQGNDEFAALGTEFNNMSQQLADRLERARARAGARAPVDPHDR